MAFSLTRLTLFAIISSIEQDLRNLINTYLKGQLKVQEVFSKDVYEKCLDRYMKEFQFGDEAPDFELLIDFSDLGDILQGLNIHKKHIPSTVSTYLKDMTQSIEKLIPIRNRIMHSRPLNYDDLATTLDLAEKLSESSDAIWADLSETFVRLKEEPSFVLNLEIPNYFVDSDLNRANLPIPDFDETGFIGREQHVKDLVRYCLGPYPVITVVGEGGVGKTAIALRAAYDLLDLPNTPFDAIVWTTSKTTQLTPGEIVKIEGAISTSLGILENAASQISGIKSDDPINEILSYMAEFRILLVIDNLETVLDDRIKSFLGQLPSGSKVLLTSRIGLGAYEVPVKLVPMQTSESIQLIRTLARIRQVHKLVQMPNKELEKYCLQLKNNPGFIKWFVSAIQAGKRPEEILANPDIFLEYCLSNVYNYLSDDGKALLKSMICLPRPHSQSELAFLNNLEVYKLQKAIQQLLTTNILTMNMVPVGSSFETTYNISDLAREYLSKMQPVAQNEFEYFKSRQWELTSSSEQSIAERKFNPYSFFNIRRMSSTELVIGKYLRDALIASKASRFDRAYELVEQAQSLAPSFFEVYRVKALVMFFNNDYVGARENYETALELEPKSPQLRLWYAQFLARAFEDLDGSLVQLIEARKLDPSSSDIESELARIYIYQLEFSKAREVIDDQLKKNDIGIWGLKKLHDLNMQFYIRVAERQLLHNDTVNALKNLEQLKMAFENCPKDVKDARMYKKLKNVIMTVQNCAKDLEAESKKELLEKCLLLEKWLQGIFGDPNTKELSTIRGTVTNICTEKFGFLKTDEGESVFFQVGDFRNSLHWKNLKIGSRLLFKEGSNQKGKIAKRIVLDE